MLEWYRKQPGRFLIELEKKQIEKLLSGMLGDHFLQIGGPSEWTLASQMREKFYLNTDFPIYAKQPSIQADLMSLPIIPHSLNLVLLVHQLELIEQPQLVLQEIYQVLAPEGQLIIVGFNPFSMWGIKHLFAKHVGKPWSGHYWSIGQLERFLKKIGYHLSQIQTYCFRPPISQANWWERLSWMDTAGQIIFPRCGAVFFVVAKKVQQGVARIQFNWATRKIPLHGSYEPTTTRVYRSDESKAKS